MDMKKLKYFIEIVEQGSISKAAEVLHMAQPPLSMVLKQLEDYYGAVLIKRYRNKWEVTEAGRMLYEHAISLEQQMHTFDVKMSYLTQGLEGELKLGVSSSCMYLAGKIIQPFTIDFPKVTIQIVKGDSANMEQQLEAGKIDAAIILASKNELNHEQISLQKNVFELSIPKKWEGKFLEDPIETLKNSPMPFIQLEAMEGYNMLEQIVEFMNNKQIQLQTVATCKDVSVAHQLVAAEVGISILPVIDHAFEAVKYLPIPELTVHANPVFIYKEELLTSKIGRNFVSTVVKSSNGSK